MQIRVPRQIRKYASIFWKGSKPTPIGPVEPTAPLVLFIHGFTGTAKDTWKKWLLAINSDDTLREYRADTYSYQTAIFELPVGIRLPSIDELALGLLTEIDSRHLKSRRIVLVCHSMGGLVARKFLLSLAQQGLATERYSLLMFGTPNSGALLPRMAAKAGLKPKQLSSMGLGDDFIPTLNQGWHDLGLADRINVRYVVGGGDQIVTPSSAGFSAGDSRIEWQLTLIIFLLSMFQSRCRSPYLSAS